MYLFVLKSVKPFEAWWLRTYYTLAAKFVCLSHGGIVLMTISNLFIFDFPRRSIAVTIMQL